MSPPTDRWTRIAAWFDELVELPPAECASRLCEIAREDEAGAAEVRALLEADAGEDGLLDAGIAAAMPSLPVGANAAAPGDGRAGPFRLLHVIGEGGMGVVFLAERSDGSYEQRVAVKLIKRGMDSVAIVRRFLRERRILARLAHRNIVRLLDGGISTDGRPFYVMEHVEGAPITQHATQRHLDVGARVGLLVKVAEAVAYAHTQLVVHRDLKPSNVLVDAAGEPHVLDFGIAKLIEESGEQTMTGTGARVLSPAYAAPEQVLGESIGTATDVYALGLMLCELLVGQLPQRRRASTSVQLAQDVARETVERASTLAARLTPARVAELYGTATTAANLSRRMAGDVDVIIATALQREPARRYPTAAAFADDLRRWLDGRPISARAESATYRLAKFVRRHRVGVAATALIALSLLGGLGGALWQAEQARQQAQLAQQQAARAERVKAFLVAIFQQNDPSVAKGQELSAAEVLRRGRSALGASMAEDPQTRGELLLTIAEIQGNLGALADATVTVEQGFPLIEKSVPADDPRFVYALTVRGGLYNSADRNPEAERDFRNALAIMAKDPHADPSQVESVQSKLAYVVTVTQSADAAVALQRELVERVRRRLGEADSTVADYRVALAMFLEEAGDYADAEEQYHLAMPILTKERGTLEPRVCEAERNYAGLLDRLGRVKEAEPGFARTLACYEKLYGRASTPYARALFSRAILLLGQRRFVEAETDLRSVVATGGDGDNSAAHAHRYLGRALEGLARYPEAASELLKAERLYRAADMPHDIQRWRARADYGYVLFRSGDLVNARAAIDASLGGMDAVTGGADAPEYMRPLRAQGEVARAQGELQTAVRAHRRWHELATKLYGVQSRETYQSAYQLGLDLAAIGEPTGLIEAASLLEQALVLARKDAALELVEMERAQRNLTARMASAAVDAHASGR